MKLTDSNSGLDKFKRQNGFNISKAPSIKNGHLKVVAFKNDLKDKKSFIVEGLIEVYGKYGESMFENFENAVSNANNVSMSIIDRCEKDGSILNEIIRRSENKRRVKK